MKRIRQTAVVVLALLLGAPVLPSAQAVAQQLSAPVIAIIDVQRILEESAASQSIRPQMEKLRETYEAEVRKRESELRAAEQELGRQRTLLSPEAFAERRKAFEKQAAADQRAVQERKRQIDRGFAEAMGQVRNTLLKIAADIASERSANILLPKSFVVLSAKELDITAEALNRLNRQIASVRVTVPQR
ncbi:MAG: OmpH family outer membrane protein [Alphaproteobacteria bacterium]|nr:OmpH family outer membrane protein [Alphaproteobacteria bacterium]